ncbi:MAG: stage II sporulation protein M [Chloroflexaceae bacterium]|jgi:uncharacterized membrane protein SpoIIM required for sporulation|nr:stage II sporulation protein M [Chloroflexaceae bacterium]
MLAEDFIAQKKSSWERLTALLGRAGGNLTSLSADELQELGRLYRQATSDLAVARRDFPRHPVSSYLNGLVARGHSQVYRERSARLRQLLAFFTHSLPQTFRATWGYTLAAALMFFLPALVCFFVTWRNPDAANIIIPGLEDVVTNIRNGEEWWQRINDDGRAASGAFIMTNNIRVAFLAFAGGVLFGLLSLYVLALNGMLLGSVAGAAQHFDFADNLWGFVAAHATIELSVIFIAGGAGMQIGWALLRPGLLTRRAALVLATRRAFILLVGCVPLLVIAGLIESYISPSSLPVAVKLLVSLGSGVLMYGYLLLSGRDKQREA